MERLQSTKLLTINQPTATTTKGKMREHAFAMAFLKTNNVTQAGIAVGFPAKTAHQQASRLLKNVRVQKILAKARDLLEDRTMVSVEKLLKELGKVAFASMQDYWTVDEEGQPHIDFSQLTPEQWAAIGEITVEEFMDGKPGRERPVKRTKFKLHDKLSAIDKAMRHLGGYAKDNGGGEPTTPEGNTTVYTLNIGTANIMVSKGQQQPAPKLIQGN